ncbi:hypothetical protein J3F83DRAFT_725745 [Trichoderma novae-zelandiae]
MSEGDRIRNHVCTVAEPVLRDQLSRSPLAACLCGFLVIPAATTINDGSRAALASRNRFENFAAAPARASRHVHVRGPKGGDVQNAAWRSSVRCIL